MTMSTFTEEEQEVVREAIDWLTPETWHHHSISPYFKDQQGRAMGFEQARAHPETIETTCAKGAITLATWRLGLRSVPWDLNEKIDNALIHRGHITLSSFSDTEAEHVDEVKDLLRETVLA